jgi:uncharacterized RDD family membrane protein YckC
MSSLVPVPYAAKEPPSPGPPPVRYIGLVTRGIAFAADAALINLVATIVGIGVALILSLLHLPKSFHAWLAAIGAVVYVLWSAGYFVGFWSTTGQTPGNRIMGFRVVAVKGERLKPRRAFVRAVGLLLAALPFFAGYLIIPFDPKRRGLQDRLARTLVIDAPQLSIAQQRRVDRRSAAATTAAVQHSSNSDDDVVLALPHTARLA